MILLHPPSRIVSLAPLYDTPGLLSEAPRMMLTLAT